MPNKVRLNVGGMDMVVNTDDDEAYMQSLGNEVNQKIREMTKANPYLSTTMAAAFAALEFCDDANKNRLNKEQLESKIRELNDSLSDSRLECDEARREIERLNKENQTLRGKLSRA